MPKSYLLPIPFNEVSSFVDVSPQCAHPNRRYSVAKGSCVVKLRFNNHVSLSINKTPFSSNYDWSETFSKGKNQLCSINCDLYSSSFVDIVPSKSDSHWS